MIWVSTCCMRLLDVVDVVGQPAQDVAAGVTVEVLQRQTCDLLSTSRRSL